MNGVEILNVTEIMKEPNWLLILGIIFAIGCLISLIVGLIADSGYLLYTSLVSFILFIILSFISTSNLISIPDHTEYQVTISDEVNFNEFNEKYEVLGQEGKIYIVREREEK